MTTVGDALLARIQHDVRLVNLPPDQEERVVDVIVSTLVKILTDPAVYNTLQPVMALQQENQELRNYVLMLQRTMAVAQRPVKRPTKKAPAPKKASAPKKPVVKKATAPKTPKPRMQVRGSTPSNRKAFKEGFRGY